MKLILTLLLSFCLINVGLAQVNIISTNPLAEQVLLGNYNPATYQATTVLNHPSDIINGVNANVNSDSLKNYLIQLSSFRNRNTGSDTASATEGIGAARRWVYSMFQQFSAARENRLIPSYLQFDQNICGIGQHRNIFAVLPGLDLSNSDIIIIEGHMDSRCSGVCDTSCVAEGIEDNGSGTALVLELARVMSQYSYSQTIVFLVTIGEEQGLFGANAFAEYVNNNGINVEGVWNNDIVGGVACGETSSPPSCPGLNHIDSTHVRIFSQGGFNSRNKGLVRFIKLQYEEELAPIIAVPMTIDIMSAEDRQGRGGDHIPFRQRGYAAVRFTSANEHGDASNGPGYDDRQHTSSDILGMDLDGDNVLDTFFVNFDYLGRNAIINGVSAGLAAIGPEQPNFSVSANGQGQIVVTANDPNQYGTYRVGVRQQANDFDTLYTFTSIKDSFSVQNNGLYFVCLVAVDSNGIESIFRQEYLQPVTTTATAPQELPKEKTIKLLQNRPNPFDEATIISFLANERIDYKEAYIAIYTSSGTELTRIPTEINEGMNEIVYHHGFNATGALIYSLFIDGKLVASRRMIFAY